MMQDLVPHLFRTEFRKLTAVLCRQFGLAYVEEAEDIVSETFLAALETWPYKGFPESPVAWLYTVAKNKLRNRMGRDRLFRDKIAPALGTISADKTGPILNWSDENIADSQLAMLFALCHPALSTEAQIALSLRLLCGFGVDEIATAFLTSKETVSKRLYRAKDTIRQKNIPVAMPAAEEITSRLEAVLKTLYLLFSEGYYSESSDTVLRKDLCTEAMYLTWLLTQNGLTKKPPVHALLALMCFQASRLDARTGENGDIILYHDQDVTRWNAELLAKGAFYLNLSSGGDRLSAYHLEAAIAYWHTKKEESAEKWETILQLYNLLLIINYSPVAALNRTYALSKVKGVAAAIEEAEKLQLENNRFYHALLGELYKEADPAKAVQAFTKARSLTTNSAEKAVLQKQLLNLVANQTTAGKEKAQLASSLHLNTSPAFHSYFSQLPIISFIYFYDD